MPKSCFERAARMCWLVAVAGVSIGLCGCPRSGGVGDPLSPTADVRVTKLAAPGGGAMLAPLLSTAAGASTTSVTAEFPSVDLEVTVFNGVSAELTAYGVTYYQEDGTPLAVPPIQAPLTVNIVASALGPTSPVILESTFEPAVVTVPLALVSASLRSFFAGPDGALGTSDDYRSNVVGVVTLGGRDVNGNSFTLYGRISITARPEAAASGT